MSSALAHDNEINSSESASKTSSKKAVIIGTDEMLKINLLNKLNKNFDFNVLTMDTTEEGIEYIKDNSPSMIIIDLDNFKEKSIKRIFELVQKNQRASMFISSNSKILNQLKEDNEHTYITYLNKSIINSMFNETMELLLKKASPSKMLEERINQFSQSDKPLSFYLLATFLFVEPIIKSLYLKITTGFSWEVLARTIFSIEGFVANFEFWFLFPIAGIALISVKSWSFIVFALVQVYSLYSHLFYEKFTWPYVAENPQVSSILLLAMNLSLVAYFVAPRNFRAYWSKTTSIWRDTTRFATEYTAKLRTEQISESTTITNISESGAYFMTEQLLQIGRQVSLQFAIDGRTMDIKAIIRRAEQTDTENYYGYGVEFNYQTSEEKDHIKRYVETLGTKIQ